LPSQPDVKFAGILKPYIGQPLKGHALLKLLLRSSQEHIYAFKKKQAKRASRENIKFTKIRKFKFK